MKITLIYLLLVAAISMFSATAFAGDHCESMHKNMSAQQWQEFKKGHSWIFSDDKASMDNSANQEKQTDKQHSIDQVPAKPGPELMGV